MQTVTQQQVEAMHERIIAATGCCVTNARVHHAMEECGDHFMRVVNYVRNETLWAVQEGNGDFASARVAAILTGYLALQGWRVLSVAERRALVAHHRALMEGAKFNGVPASEAFRVSSNLLKCALVEIAMKGATV